MKVEVTLRDVNGRLIDTAHLWVSSINITAGSTMGFFWLFGSYEHLASLDVRMIDVHEWWIYQPRLPSLVRRVNATDVNSAIS